MENRQTSHYWNQYVSYTKMIKVIAPLLLMGDIPPCHEFSY